MSTMCLQKDQSSYTSINVCRHPVINNHLVICKLWRLWLFNIIKKSDPVIIFPWDNFSCEAVVTLMFLWNQQSVHIQKLASLPGQKKTWRLQTPARLLRKRLQTPDSEVAVDRLMKGIIK